jgi:hypothetical protein
MNAPVPLTADEMDFLWGLVGQVDSDMTGLVVLAEHIVKNNDEARYANTSHALRARLAAHMANENTDHNGDDPADAWSYNSVPILYRAVTRELKPNARVQRAMILDNIVHDVMENGVTETPNVVRLEQMQIDRFLPDAERDYVRQVGAAQRTFFYKKMAFLRNKHDVDYLQTKYGFTPALTPN